MGWRYQLARKRVGVYTLHGVVEAYMDEAGKVRSTTSDFVSPNDYESPEDVIMSLERMLKDAKKYGVIDLNNFKRGNND
jgi:hypothetical protein